MQHPQKPTKDEQILSLISHQARELVEKYTSPEQLNVGSYKEIFNVSKSDIAMYLKKHFALTDLVPSPESKKDGFYAISIEGGFRIYEQYDGIRANEKTTSNSDGVWDAFAEYIIRTSGTGLSFK